MENSINYKENPEHYKRLIRKINEEVDFASYLVHLGYKLLKKSAGSLEFSNDSDRIVLTTSRSPVTYFNRNDSGDKGRFFKYLKNRENNFYEAVKNGLEIINRSYEFESVKVAKRTTEKKSLEENYNIVPLSKPIYLTKERLIDIETIQSDAFEGRVFNAFHFKDNGGKIANVAFPKFDIYGNAKNYIIYNRPYKDRITREVKKFRLVLNKKNHFLFHSNLPKNGVERVIFGENGIDLLSFKELKGKEGDFYISFGGNIYDKKLDSFYEKIIPLISSKKVEFISIMDNDVSGHEFDIKVFSKLINELSPNIYFENNIKQGSVTMKIHYNQGIRQRMVSDSKSIDNALKSGLSIKAQIKKTVFLDKVILEFTLPDLMKSKHQSLENTNAFKVLILALNKMYLPFETNILKSKRKDWNEDLIESKKEVKLKNKIKL